MTPEQLEQANQLNKKITQSKKHLSFMKEALRLYTDNNVPISLFTVKFDGGTGHNKLIEYAPSFIYDETVRANVINTLKTTTQSLIDFFEADTALMEQELSNI